MGSASRRAAVPLIVILALTAGLADPATVNPAAAIAARAGHPAGRHLLAHRDAAGPPRRTATLEVDRDRRLTRECSAGVCAGTWFDGRRRAAFGINGTPLPDGSADDAAERTFTAIVTTAFGEAAFVAAGGTVDLLPAGGDGQLRYRVQIRDGAPLVAVADRATQHLTAVERPDGTLFRPLYATAAGATVLYAEQRYDAVNGVTEPLAEPVGPAVRLNGGADMPLVSDVLPIVPCRLAGRSASCLLDTGTNPSSMTLSFAEQLALEPHGTLEIAGLTPYLTGIVDAGPLTFGGATFDTLHFAIVPRARGAAFDVVLGSDVLARVRLELDPHDRRAKLGARAAEPSSTSIGVAFRGGVPYVAVRLNHADATQSMLLDTGDSGFVSLGYDQYRTDPTLFAVQAATSASGFGGGSMDALSGEVARAEVGTEIADRVPALAVRGQHVGHIGYRFVAWCGRMSVDLSQNRVECAKQPGL